MGLPVLDMLPLDEARLILDVGTGTGELFSDLSQRAPRARIVGFDRAAGMLRIAHARSAGLLAVMDAQHLAFRDASFDLVVCIFVLFHLPDPVKALRELRRVLQGGGRIGAVTWGVDFGTPGAAIWREALDAAGAAPDPRDPSIQQHSRMDTEAKLGALFEKAGFTGVRTRREHAEHRFTADSLLKVQVQCGLPSRRLPSLSIEEQARCRDRVEKQLRELSDNNLLFRPEVVFATAVR